MARDFRLPPAIGHRGPAVEAPEKTLSGYAIALSLGVSWVETDAGLTTYSQCVVL